jgi:hypothetical protein
MKGRTFAAAEGEWYFESEEEQEADCSPRLPASPLDAGEAPLLPLEREAEGEGPKELTTAQILEVFERAQGLQEVMRQCAGFPEWMKRMFWRLHYLLGERVLDVQEFLVGERLLEGSLKLEVPDVEEVVCRLVEKALNEWEDEQFKQLKKNLQLLYHFATWETDIAAAVYNYCLRIWRKPLRFRLYLRYMSKDEREEVERLYALGVIDAALLEKARALSLPAATPEAFLHVKEAIRKAKTAADILRNGSREDHPKDREKILSKHMFSVDRIPEAKMTGVKPHKPWNYEYIAESTVGKPPEATPSLSKPSLYKPSPAAYKRPIHLNYESTEPREINPLASASVGNSMVIIPGQRVSKKILVIEEDEPEDSAQLRKEGRKDWSRDEERTLCQIYREAGSLEESMREIDRQMSVDPRWRNSELVEFKMRSICCRTFSRFENIRSVHTNSNANVMCFKANRTLVLGCTDPAIRHAIYRQIAAIHLCFLDRPNDRKKDISRAILEINSLCKRIHEQY